MRFFPRFIITKGILSSKPNGTVMVMCVDFHSDTPGFDPDFVAFQAGSLAKTGCGSSGNCV